MDRISSFEIAALRNAAALSCHITEVTIGPNCSNGTVREEPHIRPPTSSGRRDNCMRQRDRPVNSKVLDERDLQYNEMCIRKQLSDIELQRRLQVKAAVNERCIRTSELERGQREFMELQLEMLRSKSEARRIEEERAVLRQIEEEDARAKELEAKSKELHQQRIHERDQRIKEAEQRRREAEEKERQKNAEKKQRLDELHQQQLRYGATYQLILEAAKKCRDKQALSTKLSGHMGRLRSLNEAMDQLIKNCQFAQADVSTSHVKTSIELVQQITDIQQFIQAEADKINAKEDEAAEVKKKEAEENEKLKSAENKKLEATPVPATATAARTNSSDLSEFVSDECLQTYEKLRVYLKDFQTSFTDLLKEESLKKFRFECQRAVNIPLNSISDVSSQHMEDKYVKLCCLLSGQPVEIAGDTIQPSKHSQGVPFCQNLLADKLVHLGELTAKQPKTVFPLAAMVVALWVDFPDFGRLFLAHLYENCPYLVPMFPPQLENQSDTEYYKSLGYSFSESGEVEPQENFLKRMSGIVKMYAAVIITPVRKRQGKPHPHGLREGWRWLSSLLNLNPHPDICATVLYEFLEVAGSAMYTAYGKQFQKMLHVICKEYLLKIQKLSPSSSSGPRVRLETFLQKVLTQGKIPPPSGMLPHNFW